MGVLCHDRAKPNLPFGNYRVIDFTLSNCIHSGIGEIAALVDYQRSSVARYLRQWTQANSSEQQMPIILEPKAGSYKGTADAVAQNTDFIARHPGDEVLLLAADHVYKMDYRKMIAFHEAMNADATVGVVPVPLSEAHHFGVVKVDGDGRITEFVEKPADPPSRLASMGIYVFKKEILLQRLAEDSRDRDSVHDFGHVIMPGMVSRDRVCAYMFDDFWRDIGNVDTYYQSNIELIYNPAPFSLNGEWPIMTTNMNLAPPSVTGGGKIINSLVSPGCVIKGTVENSVLSTGVRVEEDARITNSVVMANSFIGEHTLIDRSIIDEQVSIGKYCLVGYGAAMPDENEITVIGKGVTVPNRTAIGRRCLVLPNVKAIDFTTSAVRPGAVIAGGA
ncbi:MAG: glucose-1-phosphate adenylyltransferase [Chloroflexi bacterium]|nr:glucose-1-phosphate adenylyltransferase [Chloroflexota bacterium]